jgi:hypothetical protein
MIDHFDPDSQTYCFARVPEQEIDPDALRRAKETVEFVCTDLGIDTVPGMVWIRPAQASEIPATRLQAPRLEESARFPRFGRASVKDVDIPLGLRTFARYGFGAA